MIKFVDRGSEDSVVRFTPRTRFKTAPVLEQPLLSGHFCPTCGNVIQAAFFTEKPVLLELYEETRVISQGEKNMGDLLKIVPNEDENGNYREHFFKTPVGNAQVITLKNHVIRWEGGSPARRDELFEVGDRCCVFSALTSPLEEDMVRDFITLGVYSWSSPELAKKSLPTHAFLMDWVEEKARTDGNFRVLKGMGDAPPAVLIKRDTLKTPFPGYISNLMSAWEAELARKELKRQLVDSIG